MNTRERLERKLEKRKEWAEGRQAKTRAELDKADLREEKSGIPLGQPILVGHHSEGRHRRAIERADNAMQRAHEHQEMAALHESKADGIEWRLGRSIFSDDENAVEALEARIAKHEAERDLNNKANAIIRKAPRALKTPEKVVALITLGLKQETAEKLFEKDCCGRIGIAAYVNQNLSGRIKADRDRLALIKRQQANRKAAEESPNGVTIKTNSYGKHFITFAEKPSRDVLDALKEAGYRWYHGSWIGEKDKLPECVRELASLKA